MTPYVPASRIERLAVSLWHDHSLTPQFDVDTLVDALELSFLWSPIEPVGGRPVAASLWARRRVIVLNEDLRGLLDGNPGFYRFSVAHELGHWFLHAQHAGAGGGVLGLAAEPDAVHCRRLTFGTDAPRESGADWPQEHQADLFAAYLLAPRDVLRDALAQTGCDGWAATYRLAERLGVSATAAAVRLVEDKLAHRDRDGAPRPGLRPSPGQDEFGL